MGNEYTIDKVMEMITSREVYLPAIQRKFVWKYEQIESLFDSIMRNYPIGMFLFWYVRRENANDYTFYEFLLNYHERDKYLNEIAARPIARDEIIGVLDGQQRLSSMYIALRGTYAYKKRYAHKDNDSAFPVRKLYLNLLRSPANYNKDGYIYEFKFLPDNEANQINETNLWFLVRDVSKWGEDPEIDDYHDMLIERDDISEEIKEKIKENRKLIKKTLRILHQRLVQEKQIIYYKIEEQKLDNILDIFVRVNSGGTVLSKSDLLFSTIIANWEEGREEIEVFLKSLNKKGDGFWFNNDFIMRSCLVLTDCPVLFKVKSFKKENIGKIKNEWENIKTAINKSVDLLVEFGFNGENLTSQNSVIPIAYYFIKGGSESPDSKKAIRKYIIYALLKQIYGGQGDQVISNFRDALRVEDDEKYTLQHNDFSFDALLNAKLPGNKSMVIADEDIEEILQYKKGPYTFMVLSLLYPNLKFGQIKFHQDHMHPASLFTDAKLRKYNIPEDKWKNWQEMKDQLPNLQLMEGDENKSKSATLFKEWLEGTDSNNTPNVGDVDKFKIDNYIPENIDLGLENFEEFYTERMKILKDKIVNVLDVKIPEKKSEPE